VSATVDHSGDHHVARLDAVDNDVDPGSKATQAQAKIVITASAKLRIAGQQQESDQNTADEQLGAIRATLPSEVVLDVREIPLGILGKAMGPLAWRRLLAGQPGASAPVDLGCEPLHRLARKGTGEAGSGRVLCLIDHGQELGASALSIFPER